MFQASGARGKVKVATKTSISFASWNLARGDTVGPLVVSSLTGVVLSADAFWSTQQATLVGIHMGRSTWWVWRTFEVVSVKPLSIQLLGDPDIQEYEP